MKNIDIKTFIFNEIQGDRYVLVEDYKGPITNPEYIDGYIRIKIGKVILADKNLHDDINYLWPYLVNGLHDVMNGNNYQGYFPDQPIPISFIIKEKNNINVCVGDMCVIVDKTLFLKSMAISAVKFYEKLSRLLPGEAYSWINEKNKAQKIIQYTCQSD